MGMRKITSRTTVLLACLFFWLNNAGAWAQNENSNWVSRNVSLRDLGVTQTITFNQKNRERHFYFPIAQNVVFKDAYVDLDAVYLRQFSGFDGLTVLINGVPVNAQALAQSTLPSFLRMSGIDGKPVALNADPVSEEIHLSIPLKNLDPASRFVDVSLSFNTQNDAERCTDVAGRGNELQLDVRSSLRYRYDRSSVMDVRSFLTTLPRRAQILLPASSNAVQYEASLRLLMSLRGQGLEPELNRLPNLGDDVSITGLMPQAAWSGVPMFQSLLIAIQQHQKFHINNDADTAAWLAARIVSANLADVVVDSEALRNALIKAGEVWRDLGVLQKLPQNVQQAVADKWGAQVKAGQSNLTLINLGGMQMLAVDAPNQNPAAILPNSIWAAIANGPALAVSQVNPLKVEASSHRLMIAQNLPVQYLQGMARWEINFSAKDLPNGERPNSLQLNVISAHRAGDTPAIMSVFMNDYLLTAKDLRGDGEVTAINAFVPLYALRANNVVRIEVYDTMQKNCASMQSLPVQILPSSYLGLGGSRDVSEFFSLVPMLTRDSAVVIPPAYLQYAEDSLLTVSRVLQGLGMADDGFKMEMANDKEFTAHGPFVSFEVPPKNLSSLADTQLDKLVVRDKNKAVIFDSSGLGSLALAQVVEGQGVLIGRVGKAPLNLQMPLEFSNGNLSIIDSQGVKLTLNTNDPQQEFSLNESGRGLKYLMERFHLPFVIAAIILTIAILLLLTRLALKENRRRLNRRQSDKSV
ncbi:MAG: hypothetical protein WCD45_01960 [Gallionella sp.]